MNEDQEYVAVPYEMMAEAGVLFDLPDRVQALTREINTYKDMAAMSILEIGRRLIEVNDLLEHGQWLAWLKEGVNFSERRAQDFMRCAREYSNPQVPAELITSMEFPARDKSLAAMGALLNRIKIMLPPEGDQ